MAENPEEDRENRFNLVTEQAKSLILDDDDDDDIW
jgi:hypothetical protein